MQAVVVDVRAMGAVDAGKVDATAAKVPDTHKRGLGRDRGHTKKHTWIDPDKH